MPTINPQGRPQLGGNQETVTPHRSKVTASTGMTQPLTKTPPPGAQIAQPQKTGQPGITEETTAAVTLSPQLTALARKQQNLQREIQAQRDKEAQWEKTKADYLPKSEIQAKAKQNVNEALKDALGMDYEAVARLMIEQANGVDPVKDLALEVEKLKQSQQESTTKQFDAIINQYRLEADKLIKSDNKYLMIRDEPEATKAAVDELVADWEEKGECKDISFYLDLAEEGLRDEAKILSERLAKLNPPAEAAQPAKKPLPPPQTRTLTQSVETTPSRIPNQFQHLSMKERIAQAIARSKT